MWRSDSLYRALTGADASTTERFDALPDDVVGKVHDYVHETRDLVNLAQTNRRARTSTYERLEGRWHLQQSQYRDRFLERWAGLTEERLDDATVFSLTSLTARDVDIGKDNLVPVLVQILRYGGFPGLRTLHLWNCAVDRIGMYHLSEAIAGGTLRLLQDLDLSYNPVGAGIHYFAEAVSASPLRRQALPCFEASAVGDDGLTSFSHAPSTSLPELNSLALNWNGIGALGMAELSTAISSGSLRALGYLGLAGNGFGDGGMVALSSAIASRALPELHELDLAENRIGDVGARAFVEATSCGSVPALSRLSLDGNGIGDAGMRLLACAIAHESIGDLSRPLRLSQNGTVHDADLQTFASTAHESDDPIALAKTCIKTWRRAALDATTRTLDRAAKVAASACIGALCVAASTAQGAGDPTRQMFNASYAGLSRKRTGGPRPAC